MASISFLIFLDTGEDSSLLGLLVLGPKGDHHGEVWLHAAAHMAPVVGEGPPSVSVTFLAYVSPQPGRPYLAITSQ